MLVHPAEELESAQIKFWIDKITVRLYKEMLDESNPDQQYVSSTTYIPLDQKIDRLCLEIELFDRLVMFSLPPKIVLTQI